MKRMKSGAMVSRWMGVAISLCFASIFCGATAQAAYYSAKDIKTQFPFSTDGVYSIDPDGPDGNSPFSIYAAMSSFGGGWDVGANRLSSYNPTSITANTGSFSGNLSTAYSVDLQGLGADLPGLSIRYQIMGRSSYIGSGERVFFDGYYTGIYSDPIPSLDKWTYYYSEIPNGTPIILGDLMNFVGPSNLNATVTRETIMIRENWDLPLPQVPVPEPGTMLLLGTGVFGLAVHGRKRLKRSAAP